MKKCPVAVQSFLADRRAVAAALFLCLELLLVLFLPLVLDQDPNLTDRSAGFWAPPSPQHLLGTDEAGRDLLARLLSGGAGPPAGGAAAPRVGGGDRRRCRASPRP